MTVFSKFTIFTKPVQALAIPKRDGHGRHFMMISTRGIWDRIKDATHFYLMLGFLPCGLVILGYHIFVGPCVLRDIPEGYEPRHWEYEKHPLAQNLAYYMGVRRNPQRNWEMYMHFLSTEGQRVKYRKLDDRVRQLMFDRQDYRAWYYQPLTAKWVEASRWELRRGLENMEWYNHNLG